MPNSTPISLVLSVIIILGVLKFHQMLSTHAMYSVLQKRAGSEMHLPNLHPENDSDAPPAPEYCIDASSIGNFARFINHSCQPNLFVQCVLSSHNDVKLAKVTLFAADTILPLQVRSV